MGPWVEQPIAIGWLVEFGLESTGEAARWLTIRNRQMEWSCNAGEALRFARKEDADAFIELFLVGHARATDHQFWGG